MAGSRFIDLNAKISGAGFSQGVLDAGFVVANGLDEGKAGVVGVVLGFAEAAVVFTNEDLDLFAAVAVGAE